MFAIKREKRPASTDFTEISVYNRFNSIGKVYQNKDVKV